MPFPFHRPLAPDGLVLKLALRLLGEVLPPEAKPGAKQIKLNNIGLGFSALERLEEGQRGIEGFFKPGQPSAAGAKRKSAPERDSDDDDDIGVVEKNSTLDGFFVKPAPPASHAGPPASEASTSVSSSKAATSPARKKAKPSAAAAAAVPEESTRSSWTCPQCRKKLPLFVIDDADEDDRGWIGEENDRVRMEHLDWHVALSFQEDAPPAAAVPKADAAESRKVKTKKPDEKGKAAAGAGLGGWLLRK